MFFNLAAALFVIVALAYLVQLGRLIRALMSDHELWRRLDSPSLMSWRGQRTMDAVIFRPGAIPITDEPLLRKIRTLRFLLIAGLVSFLIVVITFFVSDDPKGFSYSFGSSATLMQPESSESGG